MKDRFSKPALIDGAFVFALGVVAAWGLRDSYTGLRFLIAAGVGLALGIVIGQVTTLLRSSAWMPVMVTIAAFFLLGGAVALNTQGVLAMLPLPGTLIELARQSIGGWKSLLTTLAPVDDGPLLALPYLLGLVCGAGGMVLARRTRYVAWPLVFPGAFLAAAILLGVFQPTRIALLGGAFSGLAFWWMHVRAKRVRRRNRVSGTAWRQPAAALVMIGAAASAAVVLNGETPLLGNHERVVLRSYVTPPFNVGQYPSPLITFRKYTKGYRSKQEDQYLWDQELFRVTGLPEGTRMRFAALDSYDGSTWRAADQAPGTAGASGSFQRVGSTIRSGARGRPVEAEVTIGEGYDGVWLPTTGTLTEIDFSGARGEDQADFFRYNLATSTGVVPSGLQTGDRYRFDAYVDEVAFTESLQPSADAVQAVDPGVDFLPVAQRWGGGASEPSAQLMEIAHTLRDEGTYTDGEAGFESFLPGHSAKRLSIFSADGAQIAGNDEQYAAMMALLANQVGIPARAVIGATVPADGVVRGQDVRAWVEVKSASGRWAELPTEEFMSRERPPDLDVPTPQELVSGDSVPPPAPVRPPTMVGDPISDSLNQKIRADDRGVVDFILWLVRLLLLIALPLAVVAAPFALILVFKARRRSRRRTAGGPADRLAGAWQEAIDAARDLGHPAYRARTRRETARDAGLDELQPLARRTDALIFGPREPTDEDAHRLWAETDEFRRSLTKEMPRLRRWRAATAVTSLFGPRLREENA
jgi:hypothetical protein